MITTDAMPFMQALLRTVAADSTYSDTRIVSFVNDDALAKRLVAGHDDLLTDGCYFVVTAKANEDGNLEVTVDSFEDFTEARSQFEFRKTENSL